MADGRIDGILPNLNLGYLQEKWGAKMQFLVNYHKKHEKL